MSKTKGGIKAKQLYRHFCKVYVSIKSQLYSDPENSYFQAYYSTKHNSNWILFDIKFKIYFTLHNLSDTDEANANVIK